MNAKTDPRSKGFRDAAQRNAAFVAMLHAAGVDGCWSDRGITSLGVEIGRDHNPLHDNRAVLVRACSNLAQQGVGAPQAPGQSLGPGSELPIGYVLRLEPQALAALGALLVAIADDPSSIDDFIETFGPKQARGRAVRNL
jgi:hypothetical protein